MSDKIMLNFRCPTSVLEAIDSLGVQRYPANTTKHGCDRSKTLMDIVRAGIQALSDGSVVLPTPAFVRQQPDGVRQLSDSLLDARITEIIERKTELLRAALKAELKAELGGVRSLTDSNDESLRQELQDANKQLEALAAEREELVELKKQVKESEAELHREERSIELEKVRWQQQLSDALAELADAKATILKQGDKIRELERGYKFKPNPAEAALRLEIGNLQAELEAYRQQQQPATEFELPDALELLNELRTKRKKSKVEAEDVKLLLQLISDSFDEN